MDIAITIGFVVGLAVIIALAVITVRWLAIRSRELAREAASLEGQAADETRSRARWYRIGSFAAGFVWFVAAIGVMIVAMMLKLEMTWRDCLDLVRAERTRTVVSQYTDPTDDLFPL